MLVLLLMLALSAIGMVALQDITNSIEQSGLYRVRTTGAMFGDASAQFWLRRSAGNAGDVWKSMRQGDGCRLEIFDEDQPNSGNDPAWKRLRSEMGGCALYTSQVDTGSSTKRTKAFGQILKTSANETGLFTDDGNQNLSFESQKETSRFRIIARYPFEANPPSGFSEDDYCFKMVTVAAEGQMGGFIEDTKQDKEKKRWKEQQQIGRGRAVFKGKVGPVPCESQ